jgi:hypothetical protein
MDAQPPVTGRKPADLFDAARKREMVRPICVGLLTSALLPATSAELLTIRELLPLYRRPALEVLVRPGVVPPSLQVKPDYLVPTFEFIEKDGDWSAYVKIEQGESSRWLIGADRLSYAAGDLFPAFGRPKHRCANAEPFGRTIYE